MPDRQCYPFAVVRIYRSYSDKKVAGICGGLSESYKLDANLIRMAFVFLGIATAGLPLLVAYIVLRKLG